MSMHSRTNTAINKTNQNKNNSILNFRNSSILNSLSNNTPNNRSMPNNSNLLSSNSVLRSSSHSSNIPNNCSNNNSTPSNNSNILNNKNSCVLNSSSNSSNMPNSTRLSHALKSSSVWCRAAGSSTAPKTGSQTTAPGNNVAATAVIASLTTDTVDTLGRSMGSESTGLPFQVVGGYPRFQYEGYWISLIDPWPGSWANNWYDTDDVYVSYVDNGYYMYNRRYPGIGIAVSISM
jgi:hypothetical protein